ncbi:hypothetical protein Hdeb2414_s0135g00808551 [Helianthus debilis subsp. tardiflorus]
MLCRPKLHVIYVGTQLTASSAHCTSLLSTLYNFALQWSISERCAHQGASCDRIMRLERIM